MATSLSELKKKRSDRFDHLKNKVDKMDSSNSGGNKDERFWYPEVDKSGNGFAIIRFLDAPKGEEDPYVRLFSHGFQGPNGWYIENSLTTLSQADPLSDYNRRLWNSGVESDKGIARKQKRKLSYISNIYVVKDPTNPENEGQVFLFRYGKKIFDKIKDLMEPEFEDETPQNIFDFWEGCNFRLKIRNVEGYRNYDKSEFDSPSALFDDDGDIEAVWEKEYSLKEFTDSSNFKPYAELLARLNKVLGFDTQAEQLYRPGDVVGSHSGASQHETAEKKVQQELVEKKEEVPHDLETDDSSDSDDDEDVDYSDLVAQL